MVFQNSATSTLTHTHHTPVEKNSNILYSTLLYTHNQFIPNLIPLPIPPPLPYNIHTLTSPDPLPPSLLHQQV